MRFKEFLAEALDSSVDYEVVKDTPTVFRAVAKIGGRAITFVAQKIGSSWDVYFTESLEPGERGTTEKTGSGSELKVFSFVKTALSRFVKEKMPERMDFGAADERVSLYRRLMRPLEADYEVTVKKITSYESQFILVRR